MRPEFNFGRFFFANKRVSFIIALQNVTYSDARNMNETSVIYFLYSAGPLFSNFIYADLTSKTEDSWIKSILGGLPTEISGSIIERNYELIKSKLKERFSRIIRDNKETLYKSVRRITIEISVEGGFSVFFTR